MKKLLNFLISSRLMAIILVVFALSIGIATFIENDFGSQTARAVVYNAWWFELILFIGIINLIGTIFIKKLYLKGKFSVFLFHLAFLFILTGAAITRYFSFEGAMHIRQGQTQNQITSDNCFFSIFINANNQNFFKEKKIYISAISSNHHKLKLDIKGKALSVEIINIIPNAEEKIIPDVSGNAHLELVFSTKVFTSAVPLPLPIQPVYKSITLSLVPPFSKETR